MTSIGVRELRQRASEFLRLVEAGETIEVTDRGRPVALLCPIPDTSPLERLRAIGKLLPASTNDLPPPLEPDPEMEPLSVTLAALRSDER